MAEQDAVDNVGLDTPGADVDAGTQGTPEGGSPQGGQAATEDYFLDVGDGRTRYRTREDAAKGFKTASERIAQLSAYEKHLKAAGIDDPNLLPQVLELATEALRARQAGQQRGPQGNGNAGANGPELTPEQKQAREWLLGELKAAGIDPETIKALKDQLEQVRGGTEENTQAYFTMRAEQAHVVLREMLKDAELGDVSPEQFAKLDRQVANFIQEDESGERMQRYLNGGESQKAVLREAFDDVMGLVTHAKSKFTAKANAASGTYARGKEETVARTPKGMPTPGAAGTQLAKGAEGEKYGPEVHDKAWEVFQNARG